ncbi:hypothetical protein D9758_006251 [Tetrapyrgos nigripes]|uniref:Survival protein SurE-like phosphatase/nucleotidase domain-containing protein n=1 Tax=Tetrapyrgos nigripes TaxID=182062 RepID=A0A8H5LL02_9AGAR|nr:hypothetical protein D9758_006251 [Tetrapyrgos nigripes]
MQILALSTLVVLASSTLFARSANIVLTNDDGWATAMIRAQYNSLKAAGHNVVLSAPAVDRSGTGSSTATPQPLRSPCEFKHLSFRFSCRGFQFLRQFGIQTLSPKFFLGSPDFVVSGPNIGNNLGSTVMISGTVGAATEAALEGIPSVAFSGDGGDLDLVSYTTLISNPRSTSSIAAGIYAALTTKFTNALLASSRPILPSGISINVNFGSISGCSSAGDFSFILTRIQPNTRATDVQTCGTTHLPGEQAVIGMDGCFATVSVMDARTKSDVDASTQAAVVNRLGGLLECL